MSRRKSDLDVTLFLIHLALAVVATIVFINLESPLRDILFTAVFTSLLIWPFKLFYRIYQERRKVPE